MLCFFFYKQGKYAVYDEARDLDSLKEFALEGYEFADFQPCPKLPSYLDKKIEELSRVAGRYLGTQPLTTCFTLMGVGALVGALVTLLYQCCCRVEFVIWCDV